MSGCTAVGDIVASGVADGVMAGAGPEVEAGKGDGVGVEGVALGGGVADAVAMDVGVRAGSENRGTRTVSAGQGVARRTCRVGTGAAMGVCLALLATLGRVGRRTAGCALR